MKRIKEKLNLRIWLIEGGIMVFLLGVTLCNRFWLLSDISTHVFRGVPNIYTWMALWNCRVIETLNFSAYWASNAMYPYPNAFAFSENMMGFTPFVYPLWKLTGNPVLAINLLSLFLLWFTAGITYFMLKSFKISRFAALVGTLIFSFYPWVLKMSSLGRFHMQGIMWLPIILVANCRFWQTRKKRYLFILAFFWLWTFLISLYLGIFLAVFLGLWNLIWYIYERKLFSWKQILHWCIAVILVWLIMIPVFLVYHSVSSTMGVERSLENQVQYTGPVWSWLTVPDENWLWGKKLGLLPKGTRDGIVENFIFPGFIALILFIGIFFIKNWPSWLKSLKWTSVGLIVFAFGPFLLGIPWKIPMPFSFLWYVFPPMKATRNPHRLALFAVLCIAFLVAFFIHHWESRKKIPNVLKVLFIVFIVLESFNVVKPEVAINSSTHLIYRELKKPDTPHTVIELPMNTANNLRAVNFSCFHWNRVINGTSNYWPPLLGQLERELKKFPSDHTIQLLQALEVDRVIIHEYQLSQNQKKELQNKMRMRSEFGFIQRVAGYSLWSLKKGRPFIEFDPTTQFNISGPSKLVINSQPSRADISLDVTPAQEVVVFNLRAPFYSQFLASKRWYIHQVGVDGNPSQSEQNSKQWKSPAFFHPLNWRKKIPIKVVLGKNSIELKIDIMGDPYYVKEQIPVVSAKKTQHKLPAYLSLPSGFREIPLEQLKANIILHLKIADQEDQLQRLVGSVEIINPGPYYWHSNKDKGVYLGIGIKNEDDLPISSFAFPHDLFPGDKLSLDIDFSIPKNIKRSQLMFNCFGQTQENEHQWFSSPVNWAETKD